MVQVSENKILENNCYLNLILDFGNLTPEKRIKEFTKFQKNFKIQFNHRISDILKEYRVLDYSFKLKEIQDCRTFKLFKNDKITIEASVDESDHGRDGEIYPKSRSTTDKNGRKVIIVQDERDLIQDIEFLSKDVEYYSGDLNSIAKKVVKQIVPNKENDYSLWKIPRNSITKKITENSRSFIHTMKEIVRVKTNSNKNIIYFEDSSIFPYYNKFSNFVVGDFDNYIVLEGRINSIPSIKYKYSESDQIKSGKKIKSLNIRIVSDIKSKIREFKEILITVDENIDFFEGMNLQIGTKVKGYGILKYGNYNEPTISINYLEVIRQSSKKIQYFIERNGRRTYFWENDDDGIWKRGYDNKDNNIVYVKRLTESPLQLEKLYVNKGGMQLYDLKIGGNNFLGSLDSIIEKIKKGDKNIIVSKEGIDEAIVNLLREIQRELNLTPEQVFSCIGIHLDERKNLVLVIPQLTEIIPLNIIQEEMIKRVKNTDIFIPKSNYDEKEKEEIRKILLNYNNLLVIEEKLDIVFPLVAFGHMGIAPFFKALSQKKKKIDVFPGYYAVGAGGTGKSTLFGLLHTIFYGLKALDGRNIDSTARLPVILSGSTIPPYVDEIDFIKKTSQIIEQLKSYSTNMEDSGTMDKNRGWNFTPINSTLSGTANTIDWLNMDDAFREGRTILTRHKKNVNYEKYAEKFEEISFSIKDSKNAGYLFLSEAIKYIKNFGKFEIKNKEDKEKMKSDLDVLEYIILEKRKYVTQLCKSNDIHLSDPRRISINAFILVGLEFWSNIFNKYIPEYPDKILDNFLKNKSNHLLDFIKKFEESTIEKKKEDLYAILSFIETDYGYETKEPFLKVDRENDVIYLTHNFLGKYNDYAKRSSFRTFSSLPQLGEYFEQIDPEIIIKKRFRWESCRGQKRGINLEYKKLIGKIIPNPKKEGETNEVDIYSKLTSKNFLIKKRQKEVKEFIIEFAKNNENIFTFEDIWETISKSDNLTESVLSSLLREWVKEKYLKEDGDENFSIINS